MHNSKGQTSRESPVVKTNKKLFFAADKMSSISGASNDIYQYREAEQKYNQSNGISQDAYSIWFYFFYLLDSQKLLRVALKNISVH